MTVDGTAFRVDSSLAVRLIDDDREEVKVSTATLTLFEGESKSYTVWLNRQPDNDVSIRPFGIGSELTFDPSVLRFTRDNWDRPQTVTVTAGYDDDRQNDTGTIRNSGGGNYAFGQSADITVTVIDILAPGVRIYPRTLSVNAGGSTSYVVSMWSTWCTDSSAVTVTVTSDNSSVTVDRNRLTFTKAKLYRRGANQRQNSFRRWEILRLP